MGTVTVVPVRVLVTVWEGFVALGAVGNWFRMSVTGASSATDFSAAKPAAVGASITTEVPLNPAKTLWYPAKKNSFSFLMGPPMVPPTVLKSKRVLSQLGLVSQDCATFSTLSKAL